MLLYIELRIQGIKYFYLTIFLGSEKKYIFCLIKMIMLMVFLEFGY